MRRRYALGGLLVASLALAAVVLADVLGTVFFAVTVAYLLVPVRRWLLARGLSRWTASLAATLCAFVAAVAAIAPLVGVVLVRLDLVRRAIAAAPAVIPVDLFGFTYTVTLAEAVDLALRVLQSSARTVARALPGLALKLSLFAVVVFALVSNQGAVRRAVFAVVPADYRDVAEALDDRTRAVLFAIYVLQAATAFATFLVAAPFFLLVGYPVPFTLALVAAVLQFLPVVGPSILLVALAAYHVAVGDPTTALVVLVAGGVLVAWLPDLLVRPRLARQTADLPGSLYFVGFVGGLLSLGPVGIIAGPLVVALTVEVAGIFADDLRADGRPDRPA
ncbi:MAG: AI-2E family transporter [Haloferacaceae archaeon]